MTTITRQAEPINWRSMALLVLALMFVLLAVSECDEHELSPLGMSAYILEGR